MNSRPWISWGLLVALFIAASPAQAGWARFALVIGYNQADDPQLSPLRYADDDAVKYSELFGYMAERTLLLTELDADTRRTLGPRLVHAPTRHNVLTALTELRRKMDDARARGDKAILYFVYSGHGNYDKSGRGYVHLADGRWTTKDIYFHVLGPSAKDMDNYHVVLMVDACNAALLVNSRGSGLRRSKGTSLKLERYPNVGVVLSSSSVGEVHEWGRYLSGIFSHEVRSGLLGAADLNDDRKVTFTEIAAFVHNANMAIKNSTYRIKPYIRPPLSAPNLPLMTMDDARFPAQVRIEKGFSGKAHLVDSELMRYADFHKSDKNAFWLGVPGDAGFAVVRGNTEYVVPKGATGRLTISGLEVRPRSKMAARGVSDYFEERLFARPHVEQDAQEWLKRDYTDSLVVERLQTLPWYQNKGAWGLLGGGLASLGTGVAMSVLAYQAQSDTKNASWFNEKQTFNQLALRNETIAGVLYGVGGAATLGSILWFVLEEEFKVVRYQPPFDVVVTPGGVTLKATF